MNYMESKEIADLIKSISELNQQIKSPDLNIRQVLADAQQAIGKDKSFAYELGSANGDPSKLTALENIEVNILYAKLPDYKLLCEASLLEKVGQEMFNEIKSRENL